MRSLSADYPSDAAKMCQASGRGSAANEYVVNSALSHCDPSVGPPPLSPRQHLCQQQQPPSPPPPPLLLPMAGVKAKLVKPRVISKHMMHGQHAVPPRPSSPPASGLAAAQCTLLNPSSGTVVLHQPHPSAFAASLQHQQAAAALAQSMQHSQQDRRRSSGYQSTVSSLRSRSSSPLPPLPSPTSPSPRRISAPGEAPPEELSICPRCGRCRCQQCREPQALPRRRVYGRCVVSDKCFVDVLSCMIVPKFLFDHACCCCAEEGRPGGRQVPGITVSSHGGPKSSVSGGYGGMEFSSDSGVWWGGPSSSISYGGVSFACDDDPASAVADNGDPCSAVSPRPSTATNDWLQQAAAVSTPPPRLSDDPLACSSRPLCCPRWTALTCLSLCLPCLCLYPAIRAGAKLAQWCYNKKVGLRGCHCKPQHGMVASEPPSVTFVKEREEAAGPGAQQGGRCLFIVMEDT